ncbi:hypothetical protein SUGI_0489570 [Cryptomeria japonica]|uniref:metallothionein-like protein type 2 n=1 Tax=Cryptomeria japonica TaxID=3369 RepID=UPI002408D045|nr:metallothionein-like protein type 2 [Cryptomeria japonica]GLJ25564.1 hypothetical protein SUGI_0489570 [Cryptomeria japonica]
MSCCGGNCGCGANCGCGSGCKGCGMYPDIERSVSKEIGLGSSASDMGYVDGSVTVAGENGCKCGGSCTCDPCTCK